MRKSRRKIARRKRNKSKSYKYKGSLTRHLNSPITTRWTKMTTYILITFESVFVIWWLQELLLNWDRIIMKLKNIVNFCFGG